AALMKTYTDFRAFCKTKHASKTFLCDLHEAKWFVDETNNTMRFHIAANRFLRGMVRRTVGCLLMMGKGKISLDEFKHVMDTKKRRFDNINISAPAEGLYLSEVRYPYISNG
ncbi:MAG: tRNA pseudouridine(38-40) synthase TruA, partial [Chitinophagales bacterium]